MPAAPRPVRSAAPRTRCAQRGGLLFHEHEWETAILQQALDADCLYVGALGSARTHRRRCEALLDRGYTLADIDRIRGPIGLFGPTRDASSLAISVLAELANLTLHDRQ